ncbi:phosphatidate cytidylyltransferase, partial [Klebsiella pneumoniae]|nr:phosphatidate cytidylyltransferase [Klebsiella pneumoniae]
GYRALFGIFAGAGEATRKFKVKISR